MFYHFYTSLAYRNCKDDFIYFEPCHDLDSLVSRLYSVLVGWDRGIVIANQNDHLAFYVLKLPAKDDAEIIEQSFFFTPSWAQDMYPSAYPGYRAKKSLWLSIVRRIRVMLRKLR